MAMMISWVMPVNPSHPYLENDPAPSFAPTICAFHLGFSLVVIARPLDRLGRDTLSLLELKALDMPVDAQDVAGGGQLVALSPPEWRPSSGPTSTGGRSRARAEGKLAGRRWSISRRRMRTIQRMRKDMGMSLAQIAQG